MRAIVLALVLLPTLALGLNIGGDFWLDGRQVEILWRSVWVSALATLMATLWGILAAAAARRHAILEGLSMLPLLLPPIVVTMGWVYFAGTWWDLYTPVGAAFVLSMCFHPIVTLLALQGWRAMSPAWSAVGRMHAGRWRVFWRIERPLLAPYIATAAALVFLLSFADYSVPAALRVHVYPFEIFAQFSGFYDIPRAVALCLPPIAIAVALGSARRFFPVQPTVGHSTRLEARPTNPWAGIVVIAVSVGLPLAMLIGTLGGLSIFGDAWTAVRDNAKNSFVLSLYGAAWILAGAGILACRRSAIVETMVLLPLVIPGAAVGLGIVILFTQGIMPRGFYSGPHSMAYAMFCRAITIPALILSASAASVRGRMQDAAMGVPRSRRFFKITLPLMAPGLAAAGIAAFVFCLGELSATAIVNAPGQETLAMRIESLLHSMEHRMIAAIGVVLSAVSIAALAVGLGLLRRRWRFSGTL